jgi:hypothetical protein
LAAALQHHPHTARCTAVTANAFVTLHVYECAIDCPNQRRPCIRTVWKSVGSDLVRVTAYRISEQTEQ